MIRLEPNARNRMMLRLLYMGGLRREELCTLRIRDMRKHGKGGKLTVFGKGGKTRIVPPSTSIWTDFVELAGDTRDAPIFRSAGGRALSSITPWRILRPRLGGRVCPTPCPRTGCDIVAPAIHSIMVARCTSYSQSWGTPA